LLYDLSDREIEERVNLHPAPKWFAGLEPEEMVLGSSDPDARFGCKGENKSFYGYKERLGIDANSELVTVVSVTAGNVADSPVPGPMLTGANGR